MRNPRGTEVLLQRKCSICCVLYPSFSLINNCTIKQSLHRVSLSHAGWALQTVSVWEEAVSGGLVVINHRTTMNGSPGSRFYVSMKICAQAFSVHESLRVSKKQLSTEVKRIRSSALLTDFIINPLLLFFLLAAQHAQCQSSLTRTLWGNTHMKGLQQTRSAHFSPCN